MDGRKGESKREKFEGRTLEKVKKEREREREEERERERTVM